MDEVCPVIEQGVEAWGGVSVASIYSVLRTLTKHGQLEELDDPTGVRRNTKAYRTTEAGQAYASLRRRQPASYQEDWLPGSR